jgi:hypothetical protein
VGPDAVRRRKAAAGVCASPAAQPRHRGARRGDVGARRKEPGQDDEIVIKELPKATIVSVAHRVELEAFHSRKIVLERRKGVAKLVSDVALIPRKGGRRLLGRFLRHRKAAKKAA